jgi:hypothetical protein
MSEPTKEQLLAKIRELESLLKPKPRKPRKSKGLPNGKIAFRFQFGG